MEIALKSQITVKLCASIALILIANVGALCQIPTAAFTVSNDYCIDERISPTNTSSDSESFVWDVCPSSLSTSFSAATLIDLDDTNNSFGLDIVYDNGNYYSFVTSRENGKIFRLDFLDSLGNSPSVTEVIPTGDGISSPYDIQVVNQSSNWYGLVSNGNNTVTVLDLGTSIDNNSPTSIQYGGLGLNLPRGLRVLQEGGDWISVVSNFSESKISVLNFGNDLANPLITVIDHTVTGGSQLIGLDVYQGNSAVDIVVASFNGDNLYRLTLDNFSDFSANIVEINEPTLGLNTPSEISILNEFDSIFVYVMNRNIGISRLIYVNDFSNLESADLLGSGGTSGFSNQLSMDFEKVGIDWHGQSMNFSNGVIFSLSFPDNCQGLIVDEESLNQQELQGLSYSNSGLKEIALFAYSLDQTQRWVSHQYDVLGDVAPSISHSSDNVCSTSLITFSPSNTGLNTYEWDFNGDDIVDVTDMTGADQSFDYSSLGAGTYTVRLDVSDGTCDNFFEQEITIYDPPPAPSYTYSSPRTCINADFTFTNTTSDAGYAGPLEYLWEFIDEPSGTVVATATSKDAVYAFTTAGEKTVRLTSSIPGCTEVTEQTLMITPGPTANFFAAPVCQNEAMQFTNTSVDATSYSWDFGDGFMSTAIEPSHIFSGAGNYFVTLTAIDAEGCEDTEVIEVAVSDSPQISFDFDVPCTSSDGIQFFDLTTVDNADLVSWTWFVDDVEVSTTQSPQITFVSTGVKNIRLDVQSSNGCESSYSEDIEVLSAPSPDFNVSLGCQGEASTFTDNTTSTGNPVVSWLWTVDGVNYGTQDIDHVFVDAGNYDVTLEVTGQNFCSETITKSIEIIELPEVTFSVVGECDNQIIQATDQSTDSVDPIVSRRWMLDGSNVGNGAQLLLSNLADATYELALELETQAGCIISSSQMLQINEAPESSFTSSRTYGVPDDRLTFTNTSTGGVSYQWLLDGQVRSTDPEAESITFHTPGRYNVSLVTQNSLGCYDTTSQEILIAVPEVDLAIGSFELVRENNTGRIFLEVQNFSNLPIEVTEAEIVLENTFTISEQIERFIDVGESSLVSLNVGIPLSVSEPSYFCVKLSSQYVNYDDIQPINNEKCITIEPIIQLEDPFPNPVTGDQFRLKLIVNESASASISLINSAGKTQIKQIRNVSEGLNNFFIDMSTLDPGIYHVIVDVLGVTHKRKVLKL